MGYLGGDFFERDVVAVARDLIGVELVWRGCSGVIVETEAYAAAGDEACHTVSRPAARRFLEEHCPGTAYVYLNYGMYWLLNLLVKGGGRDGLVLIRALEPRRGLAVMRARRGRDLPRDLCSGPGKLSMALGVTGADHGLCVASARKSAGIGLREALEDCRLQIRDDFRVGISKAKHLPWRFLADGHPCVSVKPAGG
jgi:DNA-3-methyladenine glycosylase